MFSPALAAKLLPIVVSAKDLYRLQRHGNKEKPSVWKAKAFRDLTRILLAPPNVPPGRRPGNVLSVGDGLEERWAVLGLEGADLRRKSVQLPPRERRDEGQG